MLASSQLEWSASCVFLLLLSAETCTYVQCAKDMHMLCFCPEERDADYMIQHSKKNTRIHAFLGQTFFIVIMKIITNIPMRNDSFSVRIIIFFFLNNYMALMCFIIITLLF